SDSSVILNEIVHSLSQELQIEVARVERERNSAEPDVHALVIKGWAAVAAAGRSGLSGLQPAEAYFTQALKLDPDNRRAQAGLGAYHAVLAANMLTAEPAAHLDQAHAIMQRVIDRWPDTPGVYYYIAMERRARGQLDDALAALKRSLEITPSHAP